jgi:hypothetical protein
MYYIRHRDRSGEIIIIIKKNEKYYKTRPSYKPRGRIYYKIYIRPGNMRVLVCVIHVVRTRRLWTVQIRLNGRALEAIGSSLLRAYVYILLYIHIMYIEQIRENMLSKNGRGVKKTTMTPKRR